MNHLNSIILEGNVVRQAELSEPAEGFKVCKFSLAVNRATKNHEGEASQEVSYFDVEAYGNMAEVCEKNGSKGRGTRVVGRLKQDRWKDNEGKSKSKIFVVAEHVEFKPKYQKSEDSTSEKISYKKAEAQKSSSQEEAVKVSEETEAVNF